MLTYAELKRELEKAKVDARQSIVAVLIQTGRPMTAKEIASCVTGITTQQVSGFLAKGIDPHTYSSTSIESLARVLGFSIERGMDRYESEDYVNVKNPADVISVCRKQRTYYAKDKRN